MKCPINAQVSPGSRGVSRRLTLLYNFHSILDGPGNRARFEDFAQVISNNLGTLAYHHLNKTATWALALGFVK